MQPWKQNGQSREHQKKKKKNKRSIDTPLLQTLFFGANDAVMPEHTQHVPLDQYKENLRYILSYPALREHGTKIIVLTPPPINEYQLQFFDASKGFNTPSRTAVHTKLYADACRDVAQSLGLPVADIWTAILKSAGWEAGKPLTGSKDVPANEQLASFLTDGASHVSLSPLYFETSIHRYLVKSLLTRLFLCVFHLQNLGLHFTGAGYKIMFDEVMKTLRAAWPEEAPEKLPEVFPPWEIAPK